MTRENGPSFKVYRVAEGLSTGAPRALIGGGFLVVPGVRQFSNLGMHGIVATSLMVICRVAVQALASVTVTVTVAVKVTVIATVIGGQ